VSGEQGPHAEGKGMRANANQRCEADAEFVTLRGPPKEAEAL
jgi:hypothetical protein